MKNHESKESRTTEQLLAEADELIRNINSDAIEEMKKEHRLQLQSHARQLEEIKSKANETTNKKIKQKGGSSSEGMHQAILDIVKAMQDWKNNVL